MRIETKDFGVLDVEPEHFIHFAQGVIAFENIKDYILLSYDIAEEDSPIMCLQSVDGQVSFTVVDPFCFLKEYNPLLEKEDYDCIGAVDDKELRFLVMAAVGDDFRDTVVNLRSPVVVNLTNRQAGQFILKDDHYPLRYHLFDEDVI